MVTKFVAPGPIARRVLVVSANTGGRDGARAVVAEVWRRWPGSHTHTVEVPRRGAARAGRRLVPVIEVFDPDLVVATDPVAAAALARLQRRRGFGVPICSSRVSPGPSPPARQAVVPAGGRRGPLRPWPMRGQDAFFCYVQTPTAAQQIGAVLHVGPRPDGGQLTRDDLVDLLRRRLPVIATLRRVPVRRGRGRPGWLLSEVDPAAHVDEHRLPAGAGEEVGATLIDRFWSEPVRTDRPPWQILLITGMAGGSATVAMKLHHCLGDGLSVIGTVARLLDRASPARPGGEQGGQAPARVRVARRRAVRTLRGLLLLATAGWSPRTALNKPLATPHRRLVMTSLPAADVARVARGLRAHTSELVCALVAEALHRTYPGIAPPRLRAMFAVSRDSSRRSPTQGNWTGAVALDLPTGPMPVPDRVALVRSRLRRGLTSGQPVAAELVLRTIARLPAWLHAAVARRIYRSRFMNVIVSYLAGPRQPQQLAGAPVRAVTPVVGLADGVPVGVGMLRWADRIGIGVLLDDSLAELGGAFVAALQDGFEIAAGAASRPADA